MSNIYSVTQVNNYIRSLFVRDGVLSRICIKGEVSNCKYHYSGHIYFSLKDETDATINCIMFANSRTTGLEFKLEDGQQVVCTGSLNVYVKGGSYSLTTTRIELAGLGDLYIKFEELKKRLYSEGLFDSSHKKPIPKYSNRVGIVTASTGAAIQDIINVSKRRNPYVELILAPAKVQGEGAAASVARAIEKLDAMNLDVIIVGRGGGSIEDLWAFNEEIVARTVYSMKTPVISAVGHETDTTMIDFVSDMRAPTPSAAAELAVYDYRQLKQQMVDFHSDLVYQITSNIERYRNKLLSYEKMLSIAKPENQIAEKRRALDAFYDRMRSSLIYKVNVTKESLSKDELIINNIIHNKLEESKASLSRSKLTIDNLIHNKLNSTRNKVAVLTADMKRLSPLEKISSGYGYISSEKGSVRSISQVNVGDEIHVDLIDGQLECRVEQKLDQLR